MDACGVTTDFQRRKKFHVRTHLLVPQMSRSFFPTQHQRLHTTPNTKRGQNHTCTRPTCTSGRFPGHFHPPAARTTNISVSAALGSSAHEHSEITPRLISHTCARRASGQAASHGRDTWPFLWVSCLGTGGTGPCFAFDVFTLFPEQDQSLMWLACRCTSRLPPEKFIPYSSLTQDEG